MHEIGFAAVLEEQIQAVIDRRGWERVLSVEVRIGALRHMSPAAIELCIEEIFRNTPSAGADVSVSVVPGRLRCRACTVESVIDGELAICPACASMDTDVLAGDEFILESLHGE